MIKFKMMECLFVWIKDVDDLTEARAEHIEIVRHTLE